MSSSTGVPEAIASIASGFSVLLDADPAEFSAQGMLDVLKRLEPQVCRAQAARARWAGAIHATGAVAEEGGASTQAWLRGRLHMGDAGVVLRAAATMARWERVRAAFASGGISQEHV